MFIKRHPNGEIDDIIINETKQVRSGGGIQLTPERGELPQQMSDRWINNVIGRMKNQPHLTELAETIESAKRNGRVTKVVTGIDKAKDEIVILNLGN